MQFPASRESFAGVNSARQERGHQLTGDLAAASTQFVLRYRRSTTPVAELNVEKLAGCDVDLDTAVVGKSLRHCNHSREASDRGRTHVGREIASTPTFDTH